MLRLVKNTTNLKLILDLKNNNAKVKTYYYLESDFLFNILKFKNHKISKEYLFKIKKFKGILIKNLKHSYANFEELDKILFSIYYFSKLNNLNIFIENNFNKYDLQFMINFFKGMDYFIIE